MLLVRPDRIKAEVKLRIAQIRRDAIAGNKQEITGAVLLALSDQTSQRLAIESCKIFEKDDESQPLLPGHFCVLLDGCLTA